MDQRNDLAKARDEWFSSKEGQEAQDASILYSPHQSRWLRNRLEGAFIAGAKAQEKINSINDK